MFTKDFRKRKYFVYLCTLRALDFLCLPYLPVQWRFYLAKRCVPDETLIFINGTFLSIALQEGTYYCGTLPCIIVFSYFSFHMCSVKTRATTLEDELTQKIFDKTM